MRRSRFDDAAIREILAEQKTAASATDICDRHGISRGTFYKWKAKFGQGAERRSRNLEAILVENNRLKKLLAEAELEKAAMTWLTKANMPILLILNTEACPDWQLRLLCSRIGNALKSGLYED